MTARLLPLACAIAVVLGAALPWHVERTHACSCAFAPRADDLQFSDTVFAGTVLEVEPWDGKGSSATLISVKIAADHVWLGEVAPVAEVQTAASGASCGYTFEPGVRYIVYARASGTSVIVDPATPGAPGQVVTNVRLETNYCSPTQPYDPNAVRLLESVAGTGRPVQAVLQPGAADAAATSPGRDGDGDGRVWPVALGGAAVFVAVAAAAALLVHRKGRTESR